MARNPHFRIRSDIDKHMRALRLLNRKDIPRAVREYLNGTAFDVRDQAKKNIQNEFTVRTPFTLSGVKAKYGGGKDNIDRMWSQSFSINEYMNFYEGDSMVRYPDNQVFATPTPAARIAKSPGRKIARRYQLNNMDRFRSNPEAPFVLRPGAGGRLQHPTVFVRRGRRLLPLYQFKYNRMVLPRRRWYSNALDIQASQRALNVRLRNKVVRTIRRKYRRYAS